MEKLTILIRFGCFLFKKWRYFLKKPPNRESCHCSNKIDTTEDHLKVHCGIIGLLIEKNQKRKYRG